MKIMPTLALVACLIGLFSAIPVAHAQGSWIFSTFVPAQGSPVQNSTGGGTGSATSGATFPAGGPTLNFNATANASGGTTNQNPSADYEITDVVTYKWAGSGTPTATFHVNVTPMATASGTTGALSTWSAYGSGSTTPSSIAASAYASNSAPPSSNNGSPGSLNYQFAPNGAASASWTVDATAKAGGSVYGQPGSFTAAAAASIVVNAPTSP